MNEREDQHARENAEAKAAQRYTVMTLARLAGAVMAVVGLYAVRGADGGSAILAYALLAAGLATFFLVPTLLARRWSTKAQNER